MASKYWIKLYHEILEDPKMGKLPDNLWRRAIELFLLAGDLDLEGELLDTEGIAWRLRLPSNETLQEELQALRKCNIVTQLDNGNWFVAHFAKRQEAVDGAERVRKFRERKKKQAEEAPKEEPKADVTKRYTDIDKDIEEKENRAPDFLDDVFNGQGKPVEAKGNIPDDQWIQQRDKALEAFPGEWGRTVKEKELKRGEITGFVAEQGESFDIGRWQRAISESIAHGVSPNNIARFKEVYLAGDYKSYLDTEYPKASGNGRDSPTGLPQGKVTLPAMRNKDGSIN